MKADRTVYAAPYPATASANTLTVHTITPTRKARKTKSSFSRSVVSDHVCEKGRMSA